MRRIAALDPAELQTVAGCPKSRCGKPGAVDRIVLEHQQRVEQIAHAGRLLDLGQAEVLMRHQPRLAVLGLPQQRRQRKLRPQLQPQRQRVDEQPHHVLDAGKLRRTTRHRHAEHHVVAPAQSAEQDAPHALHYGVQRQRLLARRAIERSAQRRIERQHDLLGRQRLTARRTRHEPRALFEPGQRLPPRRQVPPHGPAGR